MRVPSRHLGTLLAAAAFATSACTSSTAPTDPALRAFVGTFVLQSFDGAPVPVLRLDYGTTRQYLVADTVVADGQGRYTRVAVTRIDSVGRPYSTTQRQAWAGAYAVRADTLDFPFNCAPNALCLSPPVGWRKADGSLVIAYPSFQGFKQVSQFVRVR